MANKKIWLGMAAALLALTMTLVSCGGDDKDDKGSLEGVWEATVGEGAVGRLTFTGSNWVLQQAMGTVSVDYMKGTFTVDGNAVTLTPTHRNTSTSTTTSWEAVTGEEATPMTGSLDGNTLTLNGMPFTKK
ncbi:MAG: hypothetical protein LBG87_03925 [Spirochaetaceae bacterium]|jgi:hypothetical protein|nr:hypothetical protein [Spirochaetaceae bacterium]